MGVTPHELDAAVKACAAQHYGLTDTEVQKAILLGFRLLRRFLVDLFKMKKEHPNVYAAVFSDSNGGDDDDNGAFARSFNGSAFEGFTSDESDGDDDAANEGKQAAGKDDDDYEGAAAARDGSKVARGAPRRSTTRSSSGRIGADRRCAPSGCAPPAEASGPGGWAQGGEK